MMQLIDYKSCFYHYRLALENTVLSYIEIDDLDDITRLGSVFLGSVKHYDVALEAYFVALSKTGYAYLPADKENVLSVGQFIVVEVVCQSIGDKYPKVKLLTEISASSMVLVTDGKGLMFSKKITDKAFKTRLLKRFLPELPKDLGLVIRTSAQHEDLSYLKSVFITLLDKHHEILASKTKKQLGLIFSSDDFSVHNLKTKSTIQVYTNHDNRLDLVGKSKKIEALYPFCHLESALDRLLKSPITCFSGADLVIDECEALTAVDVNSKRFICKDTNDFGLQVNLSVIAYLEKQFTLRHIGGIVVIDFLKMDKAQEKLLSKQMNRVFSATKYSLKGFTKTGLFEMTIEKQRASLNAIYKNNHKLKLDFLIEQIIDQYLSLQTEQFYLEVSPQIYQLLITHKKRIQNYLTPFDVQIWLIKNMQNVNTYCILKAPQIDKTLKIKNSIDLSLYI